jgi:hypothetical protein
MTIMPIDEAEILGLLQNRKSGEILDLSMRTISDTDLGGWDLSNINFSGTSFLRVNLKGAKMDHTDVSKALFMECPMQEVLLTNSDASCAVFRGIDFTGADFSGSNFFCAALEGAILDGVKDDENTRFFRLPCPESGAFLGWKIGANRRLIRLLIPADARRTAATGYACRCDKAKVLSIRSEDDTVSYDWASATVDDKFIYRTGEWVYPHDFNPYRWVEDAPGIHFFLERQQAIDY